MIDTSNKNDFGWGNKIPTPSPSNLSKFTRLDHSAFGEAIKLVCLSRTACALIGEVDARPTKKRDGDRRRGLERRGLVALNCLIVIARARFHSS